MAQTELLRKIAADIEHMKIDLEEIKDNTYPPEERLSSNLIKSVHQSEKQFKEGKARKITSTEIKKMFRS